MKKALISTHKINNSNKKFNCLHLIGVSLLLIISILPSNCFAGSKISIVSGSWDSPFIWNPSGVPSAGDIVVIAGSTTVTTNSNTNVQNLTINAGGQLTLGQGKRMTIDGNLLVAGRMDMNGGMITVSSPGRTFKIKSGGVFVWDPSINTSAEATLFTNCIETFDVASTLIVKNWYNYSIPLSNVVNGNFGNLEINTPGGNNSIVEWNQNNTFESHKIFGTLTIDQGWVTLDKSGSISNTTIGNVILKNINSVFYAHNGNHSGSFNLHCSNIINNGGIFYGLNDGNGNITIHVTGNFVNKGNVKLINNSGYPNVSNGNATLNIEGAFTQTSGDTRIIYNIATTNSGIFNASIGELNLNGGIFMGQTGCHTAGQTGTFHVLRNFTIDFQNQSDKFRGTSLSSISGTLNNLKLNLLVDGDFKVSGNQNAEVTSSASSGEESIAIKGNYEINGCTNSLNYGSLVASHDLTLTVDSAIKMTSGIFSLSRNSGRLQADVRNVIISGGIMSLKNYSGIADLTISKSFEQSGGEFFFHNNLTSVSTDNSSVTVAGSFTQSGGILNFDNNVQYTSSTNKLKLKCTEVNFSGTGSILRSGGGNTNSFGYISYEAPKFQTYNRQGSTSKIESVIQVVDGGCKLVVNDCPFLLASNNQSGINLLQVKTNSTMFVNKGQVLSNEQFGFSRISVDSSATISIRNLYGFYDQTNRSAISSSGNLTYELHSYSTVEYAGSENTTVTGSPIGSTIPSSKYGILKINLIGSTNPKAGLTNSNVSVRTKLDLASGGLNLDANTITIENGYVEGIKSTKGYIISESPYPINNSIVCWKKLTPGAHTVPFGISSTEIIPVTFKITTGFGHDISISTRRTTKNNQPYPALNMTFPGGTPFANDHVVDRWWTFNGPGLKADVTLTYLADENSLASNMAHSPLNIIQWNGTSWNFASETAIGSVVRTGTISINNTTLYQDWTIAYVNTATISLSAKLVEDIVSVDWHIQSEEGINKFIVERSQDGINFEKIDEISASFDNKIRDYNYEDLTYTGAENYYRLKQISGDGTFIYSKIAKVEAANLVGGIKINSVSPNPFSDQLRINIKVNAVQNYTVQIISSEGRTKYQKEIRLEAGENSVDINALESLEPGNYILVIESRDERVTKKLIKN